MFFGKRVWDTRTTLTAAPYPGQSRYDRQAGGSALTGSLIGPPACTPSCIPNGSNRPDRIKARTATAGRAYRRHKARFRTFIRQCPGPPARVLEVVVIGGAALCTLRTVDDHENVSEPVASFDVDAQTLIGGLQAGLMSSPRRNGQP